MEIFSVKNLSFTYPLCSNKAIDNINFSINSSEFILICGQSGCGKTTLLKLLKKELTPKGEISGSIFYKNQTLSELDNRTSAEQIGFVMQNPESQVVMHKVSYELAFGAENIGLPKDVICRRMAEMVNFFGLNDIFDSEISSLSGGQKQLVNLASIMIMHPNVIILDEPTSQLDPIASKDFISVLRRINAELGITIIIVEHNLEDVMPISDKVIVIDNGKVIANDTPRNICTALKNINENHPMLKALPTPTKIYASLNNNKDILCPITVKEGKDFLEKNYKSDIKELPINKPSHSNNIAVELSNIWYRYERNSKDILKDVNLKVYKGEVFSLLGGNGAGKTTLMSVISGINKAYRGKILINGKKIKDYKKNSLYLHNIAYLPQSLQTVFIEDNVRKDFDEVCKLMKYDKDAKEKTILSVSEKLGITHLLDKNPYDLSGGEQQKCAIAKMLLLQPKILLMDEPSKAMDSFAKESLSEIIKMLKSDDEMTIIIVTHDIDFACECSDRVGLFFDGNIVSYNTPNKFFTENTFYTTSANRMARNIYPSAVKCSDIIKLCQRNGLINE